MVRDIFDAQAVAGLKGWMGVGHGEWNRPRRDVVADPDQRDTPPRVARLRQRLSRSTSTRHTASSLHT